MAQVVVKVNDRPYTMQCDEGEEEHLSELAQLIDTEVSTTTNEGQNAQAWS